MEEAQKIGLLDPEVGEWALLHLLLDLNYDSRLGQSGTSRRLSYISRLATGTHIHTDPGSLAVNMWINPGWEDTGTSYWRPKHEERNGSDVCLGQNQEFLRCCESMVLNGQRLRESDTVGHLPHDTDHTGAWEYFGHMPVKENRMVVYNGHVAHAGYFPPSAV